MKNVWGRLFIATVEQVLLVLARGGARALP